MKQTEMIAAILWRPFSFPLLSDWLISAVSARHSLIDYCFDYCCFRLCKFGFGFCGPLGRRAVRISENSPRCAILPWPPL